VVFKLTNIQFVHGESYRALAEKRTIKDVIIPANRGNIYSVNGNLLATSVPKYDIRIDLVTPTNKNFETFIEPLCDSVYNFHMINKKQGFNNFFSSKEKLQNRLRKARENKNRYFLLARNLDYSDYLLFRSFPLINLGAFKGGLIVEQTTKRNYPLGVIAQRTIGHERTDEKGYTTRVGIDGAYGEKYLRGVDGKRLKQSIGKGSFENQSLTNQTKLK
jgi:cell division protein FtsI (penicillin-binding protein 3)